MPPPCSVVEADVDYGEAPLNCSPEFDAQQDFGRKARHPDSTYSALDIYVSPCDAIKFINYAISMKP